MKPGNRRVKRRGANSRSAFALKDEAHELYVRTRLWMSPHFCVQGHAVVLKIARCLKCR